MQRESRRGVPRILRGGLFKKYEIVLERTAPDVVATCTRCDIFRPPLFHPQCLRKGLRRNGARPHGKKLESPPIKFARQGGDCVPTAYVCSKATGHRVARTFGILKLPAGSTCIYAYLGDRWVGKTFFCHPSQTSFLPRPFRAMLITGGGNERSDKMRTQPGGALAGGGKMGIAVVVE